jgi:hypothetical protein
LPGQNPDQLVDRVQVKEKREPVEVIDVFVLDHK